MDFFSGYEIRRTVDFILEGSFSRVALQFPDELLKVSTRVASALRRELRSRSSGDISIYVMADTTYGSCCVDEVGASHVDADCVVHYGHTCLSPTTNLPALFIFRRAPIDETSCIASLIDSSAASGMPVLVLYGLEYAYAIQNIKESPVLRKESPFDIHFADVKSSVMHPLEHSKSSQVHSSEQRHANNSHIISASSGANQIDSTVSILRYGIGGLEWDLPRDRMWEDYLVFWIGSDNPAFANVLLTFHNCRIVRYDANENCLLRNISHHSHIIKRRYYLVEKAKDANIVGILVGTLGVAGYLEMIHQLKELIKAAGKKTYTLVMGRPNPAKLANFPECDVFVYVSCAETALLDSKEFMAPVITPYEAKLAFGRGSIWTGAYLMEFRDLLASTPQLVDKVEARFSFFEGGYVEDFDQTEKGEERERGLVLADMTKTALKVGEKHSGPLVKGTAISAAQYFAARSYQGLDAHSEQAQYSYVIGKTGRASGYKDEINKN